jgi:hypothetical protein
MRKLFVIFCLALVAITTNAQTFLDNLRKEEPRQGVVTVTEDPLIDSLVNGKGGPVLPDPNASVSQSHKKEEVKKSPEEEEADNLEKMLDTRKKVMRNAQKVTGYRIQAFAGGNNRADRVKAEQAGGKLKNAFPEQPIYVHFYSPRWICRMANYKTYNEAAKLLKKVKALGYPQACIVKGKITVQY